MSKKKRIVLFTSGSGIEIINSLSALNSISGSKVKVIRAEGEQIGNRIRTLPISKDLLEEINSRYRKTIKSFDSSDKENAFVSIHCCFRTKSAFYSSLSEFSKLLSEFKIHVGGIVTLIDDFYSIYFRIKEHYRINSISEDVNPLDLLYWRNIDMMLAHMLANQIKVRHYVVSVNHPLSLLRRLIFDKHTTVYAGHPITDIRKLEEPQRIELIRRVNDEQLVPLSRRPEIVTFIPDTIDETPILGLPRPAPESEPPATFAQLKERMWPRSWLNGDAPIAKQVPDNIAETYYSDLLASIKRNKEMYNEAVYGQISDRDYRLVNQSKNFVFSLFRQITSSTGVEKELTQAKRYTDKNEYFFNPDSIRPGGGGVRPNWSSNVTGENASIDELIELLPHNSDQPLLRIRK